MMQALVMVMHYTPGTTDAATARAQDWTLYNALLGGVDLAGRNFTYTNPLVGSQRYQWHTCPCCVGNIPRTLLMLPTWAYTKDADTGIVRHSADTCIGCQYCTWNCSYGVPQYNPARGVVGKCDLCVLGGRRIVTRDEVHYHA